MEVTMSQFKRVKLFSNISMIGPENVLYDEVWVYKLLSDSGCVKQKYRIRYQRTDSAVALGFTEDEAAAATEMLEAYGPAVSCVLEVWHNEKWKRCLDWMGDPTVSPEKVCSELNEQFKAFVTCVPIKNPFVTSSFPSGPNPPKAKKRKDEIDELDSIDGSEDKPEKETPDFDWI